MLTVHVLPLHTPSIRIKVTTEAMNDEGYMFKTSCDIERRIFLREEFGARITYGRPSPPKVQGCQINQQIQSWCMDQLQDSIANEGMARPDYRRFSCPDTDIDPHCHMD